LFTCFYMRGPRPQSIMQQSKICAACWVQERRRPADALPGVPPRISTLTQIEPESTQIRRGFAGLETTAQVTGQPKAQIPFWWTTGKRNRGDTIRTRTAHG
jgi:hypothetical protein